MIVRRPRRALDTGVGLKEKVEFKWVRYSTIDDSPSFAVVCPILGIIRVSREEAYVMSLPHDNDGELRCFAPREPAVRECV